MFPACVVNGAGVSKTFQILYRNEEVCLDDAIMFRAHILVDSHKVREASGVLTLYTPYTLKCEDWHCFLMATLRCKGLKENEPSTFWLLLAIAKL